VGISQTVRQAAHRAHRPVLAMAILERPPPSSYGTPENPPVWQGISNPTLTTPSRAGCLYLPRPFRSSLPLPVRSWARRGFRPPRRTRQGLSGSKPRFPQTPQWVSPAQCPLFQLPLLRRPRPPLRCPPPPPAPPPLFFSRALGGPRPPTPAGPRPISEKRTINPRLRENSPKDAPDPFPPRVPPPPRLELREN